MSLFNPEVLMNCSVETSMSTFIPPWPEGEWVVTITKVDFKQPKDNMVLMECTFETIEPDVVSITGINPSQTRYAVFLDLTDTGMLDTTEGKNVGVGKLREAVGQNVDGVPWSPALLVGQQLRAKSSQKADKDNPEILRTDIKAITAL